MDISLQTIVTHEKTPDEFDFVSIKWPLFIAAAYLFVWPLYSYISAYNLDQHGDMLENYAWGIAWQWGYYKHPPVYAWITAAWFEVFPKSDYSYRLLSGVNISVAIILLWFIAKRILPPVQAIIAVATVFFLPPLTFLSANYNATSAMVPFWAAIVLAYLVLIERRSVLSAAIFGVLCGLSVLVKYHSAVLLLALLIHSLSEREVRRLWLGKLGPVAIFAAALIVVPHIKWLFDNQFMTVRYASAQESGGDWGAIQSVLRLPVAMALYTLPIFLFYVLFHPYGDKQLKLGQFKIFTGSVQSRAVLFAFFGSVLATCVLALALSASVSTLWSIPFFILAAPLLAQFVPYIATYQWRRVLVVGIVGVSTVLLLAAPFVFDQVVKRARSNAALPVRGVAAQANKFWSSNSGSALKIVGGEPVLSNGLSFYSPSSPASIQSLSLAITPWVKTEDIAKFGALMVCRTEQPDCINASAALLERVDFKAAVSVPGPVGSPKLTHEITFMMRLPAL